MIDDAVLIIRKHLSEEKVNGRFVGEFTIAALKIASLRMYYRLDSERFNAILSELDMEKYRMFLGILASRNL